MVPVLNAPEYLVMLLWSHLLHHVCVSLVKPPTLTHQQPCAVVSLASTSLMWSDRTAPPIVSAAPRLHPLQLLFPNCVHFRLLLHDCVHLCCCSPTTSSSAAAPQTHHSAFYHTHTGQKYKYETTWHYCSPAPQTSHFHYTQTGWHLQS